MTLGDRIVIMKDGFIQQIGTPQRFSTIRRICSWPGFIGSSADEFLSMMRNWNLTMTVTALRFLDRELSCPEIGRSFEGGTGVTDRELLSEYVRYM